MSKHTLRNETPAQSNIRISAPTTEEEHKQIIAFLSGELRKYPGLPKIPKSLRTSPLFGSLLGYWSDNSLVHAVFTCPPYREASELIGYRPSEIDTFHWLQTKVTIINSLYTSPNHRRQGIALNTLEYLRTQAVENQQRYLIAALTNQPVINLFTKAGYTIQPRGTNLVVRSKGAESGAIPGTTDTRYAILELPPTDAHTITAE